jgi:hypothetical protein
MANVGANSEKDTKCTLKYCDVISCICYHSVELVMILRLAFHSCQLYPFGRHYENSKLGSRQYDIIVILNLEPLLLGFLQQIHLEHEPNRWQHVNVNSIFHG